VSEFTVTTTRIKEILPHPQAERLELALLEGLDWQVVVGKDDFNAGDKVFYIPIDAQIPEIVSDAWGITKYLSHGRTKAVKLRGEKSFGVIVKAHPVCGEGFAKEIEEVNKEKAAYFAREDYAAPFRTYHEPEIGEDVAWFFNITKYEPPEPVNITGNMVKNPNPHFHKYTDIERLQNWQHIFEDGEPVIVTEKIHGCSSRNGIVINAETDELEFVVGSHTTQKKLTGEYGKNMGGTIFELPYLVFRVREMLGFLLNEWDVDGADRIFSLILFGEIYGKGVQDLQYSTSEPSFAAFDISVNEDYIPFDTFMYCCKIFDIPTAPVLYSGPYDRDLMTELASGPTIIGNGAHMREGIVIRPEEEVVHPRLGRKILKLVSDDYLLRKGGSELH
jgi:RNA ligase/PHA02142 OB-fold domain